MNIFQTAISKVKNDVTQVCVVSSSQKTLNQ